MRYLVWPLPETFYATLTKRKEDYAVSMLVPGRPGARGVEVGGGRLPYKIDGVDRR